MTLATITGIIIASVLLLLMAIGIISALVKSSDKPATISENSVLHLKLNYPIPDRSSDNPFDNFDPGNFSMEKHLGLNNILANIAKAAKDDNIKGVCLDLGFSPSGYATLREIRNALQEFADSGKFIYTYADMLSQRDYYLASISDSIYMNPEGFVEFFGMSRQIMFFKGAFDKLGIDPIVFRHGKFKSAVEPFTLDKMSAENREQTSTFMGAIWQSNLQDISAARQIPVDTLQSLATNLAINGVKDAVRKGLVDVAGYKDQLIDQMKLRMGLKTSDKIELVSINKYNNVPKKREHKGLAKNKIAVVYAEGEIGGMEGGDEAMPAQKIIDALRDARKDSSVKAIVFRVNSPGGSAITSEAIWREVKLAAEAKLLIASMGNVAASGGYYISCPADTIMAEPVTITGSIGVFGLMFNVEELFNKKLGLTFDVVKTNPYADLGSGVRTMSEVEKQYFQTMVENIYTSFIGHVAEGRSTTPEKIDSIGQGRVWSGTNALEIGLVDTLGGLSEAIELAARLTGLDHYRLQELPKAEDPFETIVKGLTGDATARILSRAMGENAQYLKTFDRIKNYNGIMALWPYYEE